jgi:hypothetical protein
MQLLKHGASRFRRLSLSNPTHTPTKREILSRLTLDEILSQHIPLLLPTVPESFLPSQINRRTWGIIVYKLLQDPTFSSEEFSKGSMYARNFILQEFNKGGYSAIAQVTGPRFLEACRNTHLLASELKGRIVYEIQDQKAEIFNVCVLDSIIPSMDDWQGQRSSTAFDSAESAIQAAVQRMLAIDVKFDALERFQIYLRDEENGSMKERLLVPEMDEFKKETRIWRFEKMLDDPKDFWIISDITG